MKRIVCACIIQTNIFENKDEYLKFIEKMDRDKIKYVITKKEEDVNGMITIELKREYSGYPVGCYF